MRRLLLLLAAVGVLSPTAARAAGVTTHAFMAEEAISHVADPELRGLLAANVDPILSGATYPDGGYASGGVPGGAYGEISHWQRFVDAYVEQIRARGDCGELADPRGPCAPVVAHLLGVAAHGMGDEMWDWMFEPQMPDHGESPRHPLFRTGLPGMAELETVPPGSFVNTSEYAMDIVALAEHGRLGKLPAYQPPVADLLAAYRAIGRSDVTEPGIRAGQALITAAQVGERSGLAAEYPRVKRTMPWSAAHMTTAHGGVGHVARAVAVYYESLWRTLRGRPAPLRVAGIAPGRGQRDVPYVWQPARTDPGPVGGGASNRIVAVLSSAIDPATVTPETFRILGPGGRRVAQRAGFPRMGPYGPDDGEHSMLAYPDGDLRPCTRYRAELTTGVRDRRGSGLSRPYRWSFRTSCAPRARPAG